jgi:hypothetical protein
MRPPIPTPSVPHSCGQLASYRPFFVAAILFMLTTGAGWGVHFLVQIARAGKVTGVSLPLINAHGHTLIYGFIGLFILGFAAQSFPRLVGSPLPYPKLLRPTCYLFVGGIVLHVIAQASGVASLAIVSGAFETSALIAFSAQLLGSYATGPRMKSPHFAGIFIGMLFFVLHTRLGAWLTYSQLAAESRGEMISSRRCISPRSVLWSTAGRHCRSLSAWAHCCCRGSTRCDRTARSS